MDTAAIEYLMDKTGRVVRQMVRTAGQPPSLASDLLHDGLIILIEKVCDGTFDAAKSSPQTYLAGICRKLLSNHSRLRQPLLTEPVENGQELPSEDFQDFLKHKDRLELIELLLEQLGPPGNDLIRLKYLEGYSDEEQISQQMTPYATLNSLKTSRSYYLKKLAAMAQNWKKEYHAP